MRLPADLRRGAFLSRPNRFTALVDLDGETVAAHVANSGRLRELLQPGNPVYLAPASNSDRKTRYDLTLVELPSGLVSADARLPNALVAESIEAGVLSPFAGYDQLKREVQYGKSRLDMMLTAPNGNCYVEVKSVTLVQEEQGLFPDAPTERGRRHVEELASAPIEGIENRHCVRDSTRRRHGICSSRYGGPGFWPSSAGSSRAGC